MWDTTSRKIHSILTGKVCAHANSVHFPAPLNTPETQMRSQSIHYKAFPPCEGKLDEYAS